MSKRDPDRKPSARKRMFWMLLITVLVFGGVFAAWGAMRVMLNRFFDDMPQPPVAVSTFEARAERWEGSVEAVGTLVAVNGTDVTTEAGGVVQKIAFEAGQPVKAGELLVELNSAAELATLESLEASARQARTQAERWRTLGQDRLVSEADVEERNTQSATARAQVEAQRALVAQKRVRAPFDGILGIRRVNLGQYVSPGDPIVSLQSLDPIFVNFTLPEQQMPQVQPGQRVEAGIDALEGRTFEGTVTAIEPGVDAATRNFTVQATLANPDGALRPGAFARVSFSSGGARDAVVVPQTAISFNPYGNVVYVVVEAEGEAADGDAGEGSGAGEAEGAGGEPRLIVRQRFVTTGATRGDMIAVTDGLEPGERVVSSGLLRLRNDAVVTINNEVQPSTDQRPQPANR